MSSNYGDPLGYNSNLIYIGNNMKKTWGLKGKSGWINLVLPTLCSAKVACVHAKSLQLCLTLCKPMDLARQAPLSMGFSRHEYWRGLPCLPPGDIPNPGIKPRSLMSPAFAGRFFTTSATWKSPQWRTKGHWDWTPHVSTACISDLRF